MVLGTGKDKDILIKVVKFDLAIEGIPKVVTDSQFYIRMLEESAKDKKSKIHVIERSINSRIQKVEKETIEKFREKILLDKYKKIAESGKLIIGAAWNEGDEFDPQKGVGLAENADAGFIAPDNNKSRMELESNDEFRKFVMCVGASDKVLRPGQYESKTDFSNQGKRISVVAPGEDAITVAPIIDSPTNKKTEIKTIGGTSLSAPLVAGIAAELMLVDPSLQERGNLPKVLEYIEATADQIYDNYAVGSSAGELTGHGRVNFWKAVLATANGGLPEERNARRGRDTLQLLGGSVDAFFKFLPLVEEAKTYWYGFEIRTTYNNAIVLFRNGDDSIEPVKDNGVIPDINNFLLSPEVDKDKVIRCYLRTNPYKDVEGRVLPNTPFSERELQNANMTPLYLARFSIKRSELLKKDSANRKSLLLVKPTVDLGKIVRFQDLKPEDIIFELPIDEENLKKHRKGETNVAEIEKLEFDDFVFHITSKK
jgi:hypothetical protein